MFRPAQERDPGERQADAYRRTGALPDARGESAQILKLAEGYRARAIVNESVGEA